MSEITILKAHLVEIKGGHGLNVTYLESQKDKKPKKIVLESPWFVHKDLVTAMGNLSHHFAIRTFYVSAADVTDPKRPNRKVFERFHVHGVSLSEDAKKHHVIISGHIEEEGSSPVNTHTAITWLKQEGENVYVHVEDLLSRLERVKKEVVSYVREEKLGEDPQGNLFEQKEPPVTKAVIATPLADGSGQTVQIPEADAEAQQRLAQEETASKKSTKRRVRQSAENPAGEEEAAEQ